jgi:hypothetical protein
MGVSLLAFVIKVACLQFGQATTTSSLFAGNWWLQLGQSKAKSFNAYLVKRKTQKRKSAYAPTFLRFTFYATNLLTSSNQMSQYHDT